MGLLIFLDLLAAVICFASFYLAMTKILHSLKEKHPDSQYGEPYWADKAHFLMQLGLISLCPMLNLIFIYICLFRFDDLCKQSVKSVEQKMKL